MINLLIVDDEKTTRDTLYTKIDWAGLGITSVATARNGLDALAGCQDFQPDICLCDVKMPKMNGIQLGYCLREKFPECKIIYLSGYCDKEYLKSAIELQVVSYIEKPIVLSEIREIINKTAGSIIIKKAESLQQEVNGFTLNSFYGSPVTECHSYELPESSIVRLRYLLHNSPKEASDMIAGITSDIAQNMDKRIYYITSIYYQFLSVILNTCRESANPCPFSGEDENNMWKEIHSLNTLKQLSDYVLSLLNSLPNTAYSANPIISRIIDSIHSNYKDPNLSVSQIAENMFMTKTYLCSIFKKETGKTINEYITETRMETAKLLLHQQDIRFYEISGMVGINDPNYFSTLFKKYTGLSPSEYQENYCR